MGSALEIGFRIRNMLTSLTRACYRFICCHPCLVCFLGFLIILCRQFPFVFSILVYMALDLVCTGVLLGTLLFFGQFNSVEVQKEKKFTSNISSFQRGFLEGATTIARRDEYKNIIEERSIEVASLVKDKVNKADHNDGLLSLNVPVVDKNSLNIQYEKQLKEEMKREVHEEKLKAKCVPRNVEAIHEEEEEGSSEPGFDDIESSSPDACMADIIPVFDELHPLLDIEGPRITHSSCGGPGIEYEKSLKSNDGSVESDEGTEMPDYEEDEAEESGIDDESKSVIRWTEDDQKSLMDLGFLELERNRRLENIIVRRRAWKQMTEKNLIDLESTEVPLNVPPIITRHNPFDLPNDSYDDVGLPPIPGSAPSILHLRKNPFDIPFDANEEKPTPNGDSPKEEFPVFNQKDTFFRKHDSFSLRPSVLRMTKQERQDIYWKPVFVSEQMALEGTSYSLFLMQQSEVSDSKLSSVPESESMSSTDQEERMSNEQDLPQESESISTTDHVSSRVERDSQSSIEVGSPEMILAKQRNVHREEVEIVLGGVENNSETEPYSEIGEAAIHEEFNIGKTHLRREVVDVLSSRKSSMSSPSEVINDIPHVNPEKLISMQQEEKNHIWESRIKTQAFVEDSYLQFESEMEEHQHKEPVYDSSPPAARKLQSFYSIYFDSTTDFLERTSPPASASVENTTNVIDEKFELHDQRENDDTCDYAKDHLASSQPHVEHGDSELQYLDKKASSITSTCQHVRSKEKHLYDMENNLSSSDKSVVAASINDQKENQDVGTSNNGAGEFYDAMNKFDRNISSLSDESFTTPEFKSPVGGSPKDVKRSEIVHGTPVLEVRSVEDIDLAFKNLQEGADVEEVILPSMIKDQLAREKSKVNTGLKVIEAKFKSPTSGLVKDVKRAKVGQGIPVLEVRSAEDINLAFKQLQEGADVEEVILPSMIKNHLTREKSKGNSSLKVIEAEFTSLASGSPKDVKTVDVVQGIPVLEVRSAEDIDLAFKQLQEGVDVEEVILPFIIRDQLAREKCKRDLGLNVIEAKFKSPTSGSPKDVKRVEVGQGIPVLEVTSVEDIDLAFKQLQEGADVEEVILPSMIKDQLAKEKSKGNLGLKVIEYEFKTPISGSPKDVKRAEVRQGIPVLEVRSAEDIDLAFKQLQEGVDVEEVILPSMIKDQLAREKCKGNSSMNVIEAKFKSPVSERLKDVKRVEVGQGIPVLEMRSAEDIDLAFKQLQEGVNVEEVILPSMIKDQLASEKSKCNSGLNIIEAKFKSSVNGSSKDVKRVEVAHGIPVLEVRSIEDINLAFKQLQEGANVEEVILPSMIKDQLAREKSKGNSCLKVIKYEFKTPTSGSPKDVKKAEVGQGIPVLEVRSAIDIDLAFKQLQEGADVEEVILPSMIKDQLVREKFKGNSGLKVIEYEFKTPASGSPKDVKRAEVGQGIPVLEVRSAEDIDLAFKQLQEGADVEEVILPSIIKDHLASEKFEGNSNLKVIEARSLDDINVAFELTSEGDKGKLSKSSYLKDGIVKGEGNEVRESIDVESNNYEINKIPMDKPENVPRGTSNNEVATQS